MVVEEIKVKSLYKALQVLECFTLENPELGITEISEKLGLYKSNVHNIVSTFEKAGYIDKVPENDKYRLGLKILNLSYVISSNIDFRKVILPYMQEIANLTNETVYLGIPNGSEVVYLDSSCPGHYLPARSMLGEKAPLYCTGIGKAMLAFLPGENVNMVISKGLVKFTDYTITDKNVLMEELESIRRRGYAIDNMEHEFGIKCVAIPVRNKNRQVIAGISVSGPSLRFVDEKIAYTAQVLKEKIMSIEQQI